ncbi:outer membrane protein assembly factor BamA [Roseospirillum parvum]|uniref:Outer membrane protein assembly factor BamA n=1 Tax=Roseospirillum parvum TaxID=83401 RepID=A0A1G7Y2I1_9PROT|nr:outer membrane protein assembly factor BamA [Roseospirillum parvum]SDG90685.1 outer membrane protein insertion porin family [Roseospirillum parvum]
MTERRTRAWEIWARRALVWCLAPTLALGSLPALAEAGLPAAASAPQLAQVFGQSGGQSGGIVDQVVIEGNQRIEAETVRSYMVIQAGDPFDAERVNRSLKSLFRTGLFADVAIGRQGNDLVVRVVENPIINRIAFEGNKRIDDEELSGEVQLRPRVVYTRTKVQDDVKRILDLYRRRGRFAVIVDPKIIQLDQNRVDLAFEINEGPPTYVRRITFVGNQHYSDSSLREELATKEERWYRFLSANDTYDPDRLTYDRELLRRFYLRKGYADFRVRSAVAELTPDRDSFFITIAVDEGERYTFGELAVEVALPDLTAETLMPHVVPESGGWYNADEVEETIQALTEEVGNLGYAFVDVRPRVRRDRESRRIDVTFDVQEGPRVFVERIDITGNVRTLDEVIRREFRLVEGDAFNAAKLRRSRERIRALGFFDKVEVNNVPSEEAPDRTVIQVDVEERSTGELSLGVGWSTLAGALFNIGLRERNLLGRGQDLKANLEIGQYQQNIDLGFTEPYFLDRPLSAGFDLYMTETDVQEEASHDRAVIGGRLRMGWQYNEALSHAVAYTLEQTEVENIASDASRYIKDQAGESMLSQVSHTLTYDKRDSIVEPTEGYLIAFSNDFAGLGGDEQFVRTIVSGQQYFPLTDDWILALKAMAGTINAWGDEDTKIHRRFTLGGSNLRGFAVAGASPRDTGTNDVVGGNWIGTATAEVRFPLGLPEELGLLGKGFVDVGAIGAPDESSKAGLSYATTPRVAAGVGLIWRSPMGPLSMDFAYPLVKEDFDETEYFRFNFGTRF